MRSEGGWLITTIRPGRDPFRALAAGLLPLYETDLDKTDQMVKIPKLTTYLRNGDLPLPDVVLNIFEVQPQAKHFLLIVDQFEELYTLCDDTHDRRQFLDRLLGLVGTVHDPSLRFVLTLRADFLNQALAHRPFADALQNADLKLGPMTPEELRRAIEKPAEKQGVTFEAGLVERVLADVKNEPGNLPLLEFALTALWEQQTQDKLTHAAYEAVGRVQGALSRHADQVFESLSEAEQKQARQVFLQMVRRCKDAEDTRRPVSQDELTQADWRLVQRLAGERLVVTDLDSAGQGMAELTHETLIQGWARLRQWVNEDRDFLA